MAKKFGNGKMVVSWKIDNWNPYRLMGIFKKYVYFYW